MGMVCDSVAKKQLIGGKTVHKADGINPVYEVEYKGKRFAMYQSHVGEPICLAHYEDLIAMGSIFVNGRFNVRRS